MNFVGKILSFLLILAMTSKTLANSYNSITYKITPVSTAEKPYAMVEMELQGWMQEQVILDLPSCWAGINYAPQIKNIQLINAPSSKTFLAKVKDNQAIITTPTTDKLTLKYEIYQAAGDPSDVHEAIIRKNLIHTVGYGIFVRPADLEKDQLVNFNIIWQNLPEHWQTLSSHGIEKVINFKGDFVKLLHAIYVAGDIRLSQLIKGKAPVYLSLHGNFSLKDKAIKKSISKIIKSHREFFKDNDFPYYAISLIEGDNPCSMGGTRLHDSFTAFIPLDMPSTKYNYLLAHEHLHNWFGGKIPNDHSLEELNYWWTEGFTDYYTLVLSLHAGIFSVKEFTEEYNEILKNHYFSPVINEPNTRIKADFWHDFDVHKLPYYRGFIFAIHLNGLIKQLNPTNSIDNVMFDLLHESSFEGVVFSSNLFKKIVKKYIPTGIDQEIDKYIEQGKTISLDNIAGYLPLEKVRIRPYQLGFNKKSLRQKRIIQMLDPNSNAYKAGLRNGDKVMGYDIPGGSNPEELVVIKTANKTIEFNPQHSQEIEIYQIKENLSVKDKKQIKKFFGLSKTN